MIVVIIPRPFCPIVARDCNDDDNVSRLLCACCSYKALVAPSVFVHRLPLLLYLILLLARKKWSEEYFITVEYLYVICLSILVLFPINLSHPDSV